jgi:pilus assembly protein Flp/PilA
MRFLTRIRSDQSGAPAIEYALVACLIAIAAIAAMGGVGNQVNSSLGGVNSKVKSASGG